MKRNASGPLEVAEMDVDVSPHVFTLSFARADSLKSHGKKKQLMESSKWISTALAWHLQRKQNRSSKFLC